jgi:hypothetical protein
MLQRPHVVQAIGEFDQKHADVVGHRKHQLTEILSLLGTFGKKLELGELGDAVYEIGNLLAELFFDVLVGGVGVFDRVVKQGGHDCRHVELQLGQDSRHLEWMREIGVAGRPELFAMRPHGIDIGPVEQSFVCPGLVGFHPLDEFGLPHQLAASGNFEPGRQHGGYGARLTLARSLNANGLRRNRHGPTLYKEWRARNRLGSPMTWTAGGRRDGYSS